MAKIAVELEQAVALGVVKGTAGCQTAQLLARGDGWIVEDVICTCGPHDRPFEEQHTNFSIAIVTAGSFQYRAQNDSGARHELMTPGSLLLGNPGQCFECGHEHGAGDRCLSFRFTSDYFEDLAASCGARTRFHVPRLPPLRSLSPLIARACASLTLDGCSDISWEEISVQLAAETMQVLGDRSLRPDDTPSSAVARVTRTVRMIESNPEAGLTLGSLAREARLSRYHFLRIFERLTGLTPHQYVLRTRLREAAIRLTTESTKVLDIALDCGFGDVSNFNRAFRAEFGVSPRSYRAQARA